VYFKLCKDGFKLLTNLRLSHEKALFAYLKLVAMSVAHDHFRMKRPDEGADSLTDDHFRPAIGPPEKKEHTAESKILVSEVEAIVERITAGPNGERDRTVFWLHYREGVTANAIAALPALKLTQKGVESVLHRVKTALRAELRKTRKPDQFPRRVKADFSVS
jgi:RNA polymerase sigma-70 factor (ECF subfamily)